MRPFMQRVTHLATHHRMRSFHSAVMPASIPRDVQEFLDDYPDNVDDKSLNANLEFYSNKRRCQPDNFLIDEIHER